jgi:hypothetical protein
LTRTDLGYIEVQWSDGSGTGLPAVSWAMTDVTITGVTVDRVENCGAGRARYWYRSGPEFLSSGPITVTLQAGVVTDVAGNANTSGTQSFEFLAYAWQNPECAWDVNRDGWITPLDVLIIINDINWNGERTLPATPVPPQVPPPFIDTTGDDEVRPLDVLVVISYIDLYGTGPIPPIAEGEAAGPAPPALAIAGSQKADAIVTLRPANRDQEIETAHWWDWEDALQDIAADVADAWAMDAPSGP